MLKFRTYYDGDWHWFDTLDAAKADASHLFKSRGIIVGIEAFDVDVTDVERVGMAIICLVVAVGLAAGLWFLVAALANAMHVVTGI